MNRWRALWWMVLVYSSRLWLYRTLCLALLASVCSAAASPAAPARLYLPEARLTSPEVHPGVYAKLYVPKTAGAAPAVVILHGRSGIFPVYHLLAQTLADQGYMALVLDYYAETGGIDGGDEVRRSALWPTWERTVQQSVRYLQERGDVDANRIGVIGLSQGATLALSTAGITPVIKAVVAYYGRAPESLEQSAPTFPPTLILHGAADSAIPVQHARTIHDMLTKHGRTVAMHVYPDAVHGFDMHWKGYDPHATADARQRTLAFLAHHLRSPETARTPALGVVPPAKTFAEVAMHFYTVELPALTHVPGAQVKQLFALPVIDPTHYTFTNENGKDVDYSSRRDALATFHAAQEKDGYARHTVYKIEDMSLTDAAHGTVTYTAITMWTHAGSGTEGLILQPGVSVWERRHDQWYLVSDKHGPPYRTYTQSRSR
jgi:dienelactone hydrolase